MYNALTVYPDIFYQDFKMKSMIEVIHLIFIYKSILVFFVQIRVAYSTLLKFSEQKHFLWENFELGESFEHFVCQLLPITNYEGSIACQHNLRVHAFVPV